MKVTLGNDEKDIIESLIVNFDNNLRDSNVRTDGFDFDWPVYRNSLIKDFCYFGNHLKSDRETKILDIGVGIGLTSFILSNLGFNVSSCDIPGEKRNMDIMFDQSAIFNLKFMYDIEFKYSRVDRLPFGDLSFDVIFLYAVIEHIEVEYLNFIMSEIKRVLKKSGKVFIFKCPQKYSYCEFLTRKLLGVGHKYLWTPSTLKNKFSEFGFSLKDIEIYDLFPMTLIHKKLPYCKGVTKTMLLIENIIACTPLTIFYHNLRSVFVKN